MIKIIVCAIELANCSINTVDSRVYNVDISEGRGCLFNAELKIHQLMQSNMYDPTKDQFRVICK